MGFLKAKKKRPFLSRGKVYLMRRDWRHALHFPSAYHSFIGEKTER